MYKVKIIFLLKHKDNTKEWSEQWVDANSSESDELNALLDEYSKKEQEALSELFGDIIKVVDVMVDRVCDITDGKYQCGSCECFFNKLEDGDCPFCGSGNWVEGSIDDPETPKKCFNHCPKCNATDPDIEWGDKDWFNNQAYQSAECLKCGCKFKEFYEYSDTEIDGEK